MQVIGERALYSGYVGIRWQLISESFSGFRFQYLAGLIRHCLSRLVILRKVQWPFLATARQACHNDHCRQQCSQIAGRWTDAAHAQIPRKIAALYGQAWWLSAGVIQWLL